jgi:hypothetical protein
MREDRTAGPRPSCSALAGVLESDEFMDKLVSMLENPDRSAAALTLVESMQRTGPGAAGASAADPHVQRAAAAERCDQGARAGGDVLVAAVKKGDIGGSPRSSTSSRSGRTT